MVGIPPDTFVDKGGRQPQVLVVCVEGAFRVSLVPHRLELERRVAGWHTRPPIAERDPPNTSSALAPRLLRDMVDPW